MYILFYKADNDAPAFRINCAKLQTDELMDLFDWLCTCKRGDEAIPVYTMDMLKDK